MFKTQARPAFRLKYFQCKKGSYHDGQVLNYVCIQKNCKDKGLICSVCKNDHNGHQVIPLKYLLNRLKSHQQQPMQSQNFQEDLQQLQELKNSFLFDLKNVVQKFAQKIQKIEQEIIESYKKKKVQLLNQIQMNMKFNEVIEQTLNNDIQDQQTFQKDFKIIASLVLNNDKNQSDKINHQHISFAINLKTIIKEYQASYQSFSKKINQFLKSSQLILEDLMINTIKHIQIKVQEPTQFNINCYKFSSDLKGKNMNLANDNKYAQCMTTGSQRFVLVDGPIKKKGSFIKFKITKLKNWIGLGLAIRNNIVKKNYHFLYNDLGHGSFLLSNNNYSWSHAFKQNNLQTNQFNFLQGNIIKIQIKQNQLVYTNQTLSNKNFVLPIKLTQDQWKEACFCVNLCSAGDAVTIL